MALTEKRQAAVLASIHRFAHVITLGGWVSLLMGERIVDSPEYLGLSKGLTWLGVIVILLGMALRLNAMARSKGEERIVARSFAVAAALGVLALFGYYATTEGGRAALGFELPKLGKPDLFGDVMTTAWVSLLVLSVLPATLGEIARSAMFRAV